MAEPLKWWERLEWWWLFRRPFSRLSDEQLARLVDLSKRMDEVEHG